MKKVGVVLLLLIGLALSGCGTSGNSDVISGNWTAALTNSANGTTNLSFTVSLTDMGNGGLSVTNLSFNTATPCFGSSTTATGGFTLTGTTNGVTTGGFQMSVQSGPAGSGNNNMLTLQGTISNNTISGNWNLSGVTGGCSGSGTFTMNKM